MLMDLAHPPAILSVYNKQGLLDLAKGLIKHDIRLLASGGTAKRRLVLYFNECDNQYSSALC